MRRLVLALLAVALCAPLSAQQTAAPKPIDQYATTAENGLAHGSADAPLKLVEYFSPTCPHCQHFHDEADASLTTLIAQGKVRYEVRPLLLPHPHDAMLDVLIRCGTPKQGFALADRFFARLEPMYTILQKAAKANTARWEKMSTTALSLDFATRLGVFADARRVGLSAVKARQCLRDEKNYIALGAIAAAADEQHINGTPTFYLNGALVDVPETSTPWTVVKSALDTALAPKAATPASAPAAAPAPASPPSVSPIQGPALPSSSNQKGS